MQESCKDAFFEAADTFECWIGLREPNPQSDKFIGRVGHRPKPLMIKAKTADRVGHRFAGLVVDPHVCPDAFYSPRNAEYSWDKFLQSLGGHLPKGDLAVCQDRGKEGLLTMDHAFVYADYDLMALIKSNNAGDILSTSEQEQRELFASVANSINQRVGVDIIQHGAEFMWRDGVGGRKSESVYWFGPGRQFQIGTSSMPTKERDGYVH